MNRSYQAPSSQHNSVVVEDLSMDFEKQLTKLISNVLSPGTVHHGILG